MKREDIDQELSKKKLVNVSGGQTDNRQTDTGRQREREKDSDRQTQHITHSHLRSCKNDREHCC